MNLSVNAIYSRGRTATAATSFKSELKLMLNAAQVSRSYRTVLLATSFWLNMGYSYCCSVSQLLITRNDDS
ncbi:unnamed protein product [Rodentolepis nana]|uniref:Uncharacterized protein n=1 Tax=Rodentolepis nana TaxID=102285 RepID=A0A0R3T148_RODNA|nr:unnamed protein product [Rodentolepis nana]